MKTISRLLLSSVLALAVLTGCSEKPTETVATAAVVAAPIPVKFVVVTMFEIGEDTGDKAGEFQLWKERQKLDTRFPFPNGYHDIYMNETTGVMGIVTGIGTAYSTASIMALGMDPRFDFSKAYWLVAGIAGIDPEDASIGSAAWAEYLVDGDLGHEIDAREIPADWETGYFARHTQKPYDPNKPKPTGEMWRLNPELTEWAYQLTKDIELPDLPGLADTRALYTGHPNAQKPPFVLKGDQLAAMTFWHGAIMNDWANKWTRYWTDGQGEFVTSAMEDTGTYLSISMLHNIGKADKNRLMVLRTGSNYTMPPPGVSAVESLLAENEGYAGLDASLESAYIVGTAVMDKILSHWETYKDKLPTPADLP
ncbi:purine nucleoside permease [Cellvibrio japonicus]|uniref:Putative purine nucleoside permease n=1 Tax=Cellvibrio japonicus (strain Ueda107) TaxID=498211 RepID=B3PJG8_CELJU|nr:purine nucleoside permease [Cellvibrio japonicus]ACE84903.1 putative purine nucleoside permease [Cellvibrio japonicus Ueda107]QEI11258.1 purine nucleoside permease [Cellvibrio japonicus]QEI14832.1 purine nucleoside permease [Cellvibrio japonicus]QEI18412.1 purine nucleoside permease [Cellvibrio japonicus]